jgi:hypothetical protein
MDRALVALRRLQSRNRVAAQKQRQTHILSNEEQEKWIEEYVEREAAVATRRVQDAQTAKMQEQEHMGNVDKAQSTTSKAEITFEEMLNAIGDSMSDLAMSKNEEDGEDEDDDEEDTEHGTLSDNEEPGWLMGTISKMVPERMECIRQNQLRLDEKTQQLWGDAGDFVRERDMKYRRTELEVLALGKPLPVCTAATPSPTSFAEFM